MCGRFGLFAPREELEAHFAVDLSGVALQPRYNIAPGTAILTLAGAEGPRTGDSAQWGFVPPWAKDATRRSINARCERVADAPTFRDAFRRGRCLVPASGYYEWESDSEPEGDTFALRAPSARRPHWHTPAGGGPLAFAALRARWPRDDAEAPYHCAILTTAARGDAARIHDRMPLAVPPSLYDAWLRDDAGSDLVARLIERGGELSWSLWAVSDAVGNPRRDGPELLSERSLR